MKKPTATIFKFIISVLLFLNNTSTYSQKLDTIEVSNSKENDKFEISVLSYFEENILCLKIEKTLPIANSGNKSDFRSEYMYQIPNSQKAIIKLFFVDSKIKRGVFEKKAMRRIFNKGFQKRGDILKENITIDKLNIESDKLEGTLKIQLPFSFGWLDSDSIVKVNFKTKIYDLPTKQAINPDDNQSYSIKSNLIKESDKVLFDNCTLTTDSLKSIFNLKIGDSDDMSGSIINLEISKELGEIIKITSYDYSDIEGEKSYSYPYFKLEFNRNPFKKSEKPLIGKYSIATDSLPNKYGDKEIRSGFFKCK